MDLKREHHVNFWYWVVALLGLMLIQDYLSGQILTKTIPYSEFSQLVAQGKVADLVIGDAQITGKLLDA